MKHRFGLAIVPAMIALMAFSASSASAALSSEKDKLSYTIGADIGSNFHAQGIEVEPDVFLQGLEDGLAGKQLQISDKEMEAVLKKFQSEMMAKKMSQMKEMSAKNKKEGEAFFAENKKKAGVVTLPDGLQYKILEAGKGAKPSKTDTVTVEYTGKLINGTVFDSTEKTGKPVSFKVNQVIPGWTQALQLMPAGSTWEVYIPSSLAYGERGVGGPIGPNESLIFKIHLVSVSKGAKK